MIHPIISKKMVQKGNEILNAQKASHKLELNQHLWNQKTYPANFLVVLIVTVTRFVMQQRKTKQRLHPGALRFSFFFFEAPLSPPAFCPFV